METYKACAIVFSAFIIVLIILLAVAVALRGVLGSHTAFIFMGLSGGLLLVCTVLAVVFWILSIRQRRRDYYKSYNNVLSVQSDPAANSDKVGQVDIQSSANRINKYCDAVNNVVNAKQDSKTDDAAIAAVVARKTYACILPWQKNMVLPAELKEISCNQFGQPDKRFPARYDDIQTCAAACHE